MHTDILILTDILKKFRDLYLDIFNLDAAYFIIEPGLAYLLKYTKIKLKCLKGHQLLLML